MASTGEPALAEDTLASLRALASDVDIKVFHPHLTPLPRAVRLASAHVGGLGSRALDRDRGDRVSRAVEAYHVMGVPKVVINDRVQFEGAVPEQDFLGAVLQAVETS